MSASPNLRLPYIDANQNQKSVTHNAALAALDVLVNLHVQSNALATPPSAPADGQCWIVASAGSGAWAGKDGTIAAWQDGAWNFYAPNKGFIAFIDAIGGALMWNGTAWIPLVGAVTQLSLNALAIGTAIDVGNPLSAKLNSGLFAARPTGAGGTGDVRLTVSKQGAGNTASFLFQDAFSGRAEIGLAGDDDFHFKVSGDGATFVDAMAISAATGTASFGRVPTAPTPAAGDSSGKLATTAFVAAALSPPALATLAEGPAGSTLQLGVLEERLTLSGASTTTAMAIPAGGIVFGVSSRVVTAVSGAPSFGIGVPGSPAQFGSGFGTAAGATGSGAISPSAFSAATPIVVSATSGGFTGGAVRLAIHYLLCGAPTA